MSFKNVKFNQKHSRKNLQMFVTTDVKLTYRFISSLSVAVNHSMMLKEREARLDQRKRWREFTQTHMDIELYDMQEPSSLLKCSSSRDVAAPLRCRNAQKKQKHCDFTVTETISFLLAVVSFLLQ